MLYKTMFFMFFFFLKKTLPGLERLYFNRNFDYIYNSGEWLWVWCVGKQHHLSDNKDWKVTSRIQRACYPVICRDELRLVGDIGVLKLYKGSNMAPGIPDTPDKENCITPQHVLHKEVAT